MGEIQAIKLLSVILLVYSYSEKILMLCDLRLFNRKFNSNRISWLSCMGEFPFYVIRSKRLTARVIWLYVNKHRLMLHILSIYMFVFVISSSLIFLPKETKRKKYTHHAKVLYDEYLKLSLSKFLVCSILYRVKRSIPWPANLLTPPTRPKIWSLQYVSCGWCPLIRQFTSLWTLQSCVFWIHVNALWCAHELILGIY